MDQNVINKIIFRLTHIIYIHISLYYYEIFYLISFMLELQINISKNILYHECGETNMVHYLRLWSTSLNYHLKFKNQTNRCEVHDA